MLAIALDFGEVPGLQAMLAMRTLFIVSHEVLHNGTQASTSVPRFNNLMSLLASRVNGPEVEDVLTHSDHSVHCGLRRFGTNEAPSVQQDPEAPLGARSIVVAIPGSTRVAA